MTESVEVRWFFKGKPEQVRRLFDTAIEAAPRTDWYAFPCDERSGIKIREGKFETKLRVQYIGTKIFGISEGRVERWKKWSVLFSEGDLPSDDNLLSAGWIAVEKQRSLRVFRVNEHGVKEIKDPRIEWPENGALFEYTQLDVEGTSWWTAGFESFGPSENLYRNLQSTVESVVPNLKDPLLLTSSNSYAYPKWLQFV